MSNDDRYKRWLLIVREHLIDDGVRYDPEFDWRAQFDDGQKPIAAILAYRVDRNI